MAALVTGEGNWLPPAMTIAAIGCGVGWGRLRSRTDGRSLTMFAMNRFVGLTIAIMGIGHLLAVTVKFRQGTLEGHPALLYAIVVPASLMVAHSRTLPAGRRRGDLIADTAAGSNITAPTHVDAVRGLAAGTPP